MLGLISLNLSTALPKASQGLVRVASIAVLVGLSVAQAHRYSVTNISPEKCDKKRPECSQCIRVGKKCPGYRDQLSLMFRDESSKVIQKAHAQWGTPGSAPGSPDDDDSESSALYINQTSVATTNGPSGHRPQYPRPGSLAFPPASATQEIVVSRIPRRVEPNLDQRGLKFYMERYLLNHPDSPTPPEFMELYAGDEGAIQNVMIAVGLAGMSNLLGNKSMNLVARSKYVTALKQTGQLIASSSRDYATVAKPLRSIVTLALFEVRPQHVSSVFNS